MPVSVEAYVLTNLVMDFLAASVLARSLGRVRWGRVTLAAALGAAYATLAQLPALGALRSPLAVAASAVALAAVALAPDSVRGAVTRGMALLAGGVFLGGVQLAAVRMLPSSPVISFLVGAALGACALMCVLAMRRRRLVTWEVRVLLSALGGQARFTALIDTGNRLREPLSGLPVLICERSVLRGVLPPDYDALDASQTPPGFRMVGYGALGGGGRMRCFRPDICMVDYGNGFLRSPDLWVAVYPGKMPGGVHALAPPIVGAADGAHRPRAAGTTM